MTLWALGIQLKGFYDNGQFFLAALDVVILVTAIWVALESFSAFQKARTGESGA